MIPLAAGDTVTVTRVTTDSFGDRTDGASHDVSGCAIWPTSSVETVDGQDSVVWGLTVLMPSDSDVLATDRVVVRGVTYDVNGQPALYRSPITGTEAGIEVHLQAHTG